MYYFEDIINEIENNLLNETDVSSLARKMNVSVYEFRRIFTFITKMPLGEYIRKRRLSLAAIDLYQNKCDISDMAEKYGYDSPSSFTRAFRDFHGVTPKGVINGENTFKILTKISAEIVISGCKDISCNIVKSDEFYISGICGISALSDTECCENVWNNFYDWDMSEEMCRTNDKIYAAYMNEGSVVRCYIGVCNDLYSDCIKIPSGEWACFTLRGTDDNEVNEFYNSILSQWLVSAGYEKNTSLPNIEIFPSDMTSDDFEWEIRIPVTRKL